MEKRYLSLELLEMELFYLNAHIAQQLAILGRRRANAEDLKGEFLKYDIAALSNIQKKIQAVLKDDDIQSP